MSHRTQRDINAVIGHGEAIAARLPAWLEHHARLVAILDGHVAGTDAPKVARSRDEATTVERAACERLNLQAKLQEVADEIDAARLVLLNLRRMLERNVTIDAQLAPPRCDSTGREGAIEWSDPTCRDVPSRGPLCDRCAKREYRWRCAHELPPRRDGVFSEPAVTGHVPS